MAEFYLDVSAIGTEYQAYTDTPTTWAVPQDGNGKAGPGHAAAVAIATIDCNGASASGTGTVGVLGVTVSSTLNASGAALATAIVTAINASATATSATYSAALLPLNKLVFARVNPSVNTEVQIMLRIAGVDWNGMSPTRANITGGGVTAFAGGANGPFAYVATNSTVFGKTAKGYGLFTALRVAAVTETTLADVIHIRTRRSGADLTVAFVESTTRYDWVQTPTGISRVYMVDDGTVWAGDAGVFTLSLNAPSGVAGGLNNLRISSGSTLSISSRSGRRFRWLFDCGGALGWQFNPLGGEVRMFHGVVIEEAAGLTGSGIGYFLNNTGNVRFQLSDCKWIAKGPRTLAQTGSNPSVRFEYINCEFEYFGLTAAVTNIVNLNIGGAGDWRCCFIGCNFYDRNGVYSVVSPVIGGTYISAAHQVIFDGCSGVTDVASGWAGAVNDGLRSLVWENFGPSRDWRIEGGQWLCEWRAGQNFPTLTSQLPGGTPWSVKALIRNTMIWGVPQRLLKLPGYTRATTGIKTITLEYLAQLAFTHSQLGILVAYIDNNDVIRYETTLQTHAQHLLGGTANPTSSATWTLNGTTGYTAYKIELTTAFPVKIGTEYVVYLVSAGTLAGDEALYVNGEVALT